MLYTVEVVRHIGDDITKDEYPFYGKDLQQVCDKLDSRIKREGGLIDKLPFNSINVIAEDVVMTSRYNGTNWTV